MKISIAATNPCHLYPIALELRRAGALGAYYSGYPEWKLNAPPGVPVKTHSFRTLITYGALKLPAPLRPAPKELFRWQDHGFDAWVGRALERCDFLHAMPGQALRGFERARKLGVRTVLNHATGPVRDWIRIMAPEYQRVGMKLTDVCPYDAAYLAREDREYELADFHCVASTVVRDQLIALGVEPGKIWMAGYGADETVFHARNRTTPDKFRIVFAGQVGLRKGIRTLLDALELAGDAPWEMHFYGGVAPEAEPDLASYQGKIPLATHGSVSQATLAEAFRAASLLVLPSLEEGFGLVIPQALSCGIPCIVTNRVGGKDLIRHRENGSIIPTQDPASLAAEIAWWQANWHPVAKSHPWADCARQILDASARALGSA